MTWSKSGKRRACVLLRLQAIVRMARDLQEDLDFSTDQALLVRLNDLARTAREARALVAAEREGKSEGGA
jgi:hypothetical protein